VPRDDRKGSDLLEALDSLEEVTVRLPTTRGGPEVRPDIPTLRVVAGRDMLKFLPLTRPGVYHIGREDNADLHLSDVTVSKRHSRVTVDGRGGVTVQDLGSTNGTSVNGHAVVAPSLLRAGDHLDIGGVSLRLDLLSLDELRHLDRVLHRLESAHRDPLTGLLTRAYIEDGLPHLADQCAQAHVPLTCAFVDVDRFKPINDTYGHAVGDEVLTGIARLIMIGVRDADPCVRYGGEEIVIFLPGTEEERGLEVADRIRRSIAAHDWGRTATGLMVTASFGIAQRAGGEPVRDWMNRADRAVYAAKHSGRNRVLPASLLP
jgi:diguanylate cyclase (GGDEF)-like protein